MDLASEASLEGRSSTTWRDIVQLMRRPQPVTIPMVTLFAIIPLYLFIETLVEGRLLHVPEIALDRALPLAPAWSLVYLSLLLAAFLPVLVVHQQDLVRRTILAFLSVWLFSYAVFVAYPTLTPRPDRVEVDGFTTWLLVQVYASDVEINCFPSLHVAQCCLAAFACHKVHRGVGLVTCVWALLVALSTLFTKQHYVLDALAGAAIAWVAYRVFMRSFASGTVPEDERRLAPVLAGCAFALYGVIVVGLVTAYLLGLSIT